ncbi:MAG: hypothetical protein SVY41_02370 [Candidatus Nanohaloarchaea archaeon]|nr:hypothetical protein [Candidatus Nanohaloarchaea archaeon]
MGRTNPTFRRTLRRLKEQWDDYRKGLRREDQEQFDQLLHYAEEHADAAGYMNPDKTMDAILLSMLLEQQKRIEELKSQV